MLLLLGGLGLGLGLGDTLRGGGLLLLDRLVTGLGLLLNGVCLGLMLMLLLMDGCRAGPGLSLLDLLGISFPLAVARREPAV